MNSDTRDKITAYLTKALDTTDPEVAHRCSERAETEVFKWEMDDALAAHAFKSSEAVIYRAFQIRPPYTVDSRILFSSLAISMNCRAVEMGRTPDGGTRMRMFGYRSDISRFAILWNAYRHQLDNLLQYVGGHNAATIKSNRIGFYATYRTEIVERLERIEWSMRANDPRQPDPILDARELAVVRRMREMRHDGEPTRSSVKRNLSAASFDGATGEG